MLIFILKIVGTLFVIKLALGALGWLWGGINDISDIARKKRKEALGFGRKDEKR